MGQEQKGGKSGVGVGKEGNAKKTLSRGPNFVRVVRERLLRRLR